MITQRKIFDVKNKKLYSTTISGTFCTLLVARFVFEDECAALPEIENRQNHALLKTVRALGLFSDLVATTYWYPKLHVDGYKAVQHFNNAAGMAIISEQQASARMYVQSCDSLCGISEIARSKLDKPNLHRIIELYKHSVPAMGHTHHFSELIFEFAHQPLKRGVAMSNHRKPHIQAAKHTLADDWEGRLASLAGSRKESNVGGIFESQLRTCMGGNRALEGAAASTSKGIPSLENVLIKPVIQKICGALPSQTANSKMNCMWFLHNRKIARDSHAALAAQVDSLVLNQFQGARRLQLYTKAKRKNRF